MPEKYALIFQKDIFYPVSHNEITYLPHTGGYSYPFWNIRIRIPKWRAYLFEFEIIKNWTHIKLYYRNIDWNITGKCRIFLLYWICKLHVPIFTNCFTQQWLILFFKTKHLVLWPLSCISALILDPFLSIQY